MKNISEKPFEAASYLSQDFTTTCLGSVVKALVAEDVPQLAKELQSIQVVGSGVAATLGMIADAVTYGGDVDRLRLAETLQLMASLTQFCADASEAVSDADYRMSKRGGICH